MLIGDRLVVQSNCLEACSLGKYPIKRKPNCSVFALSVGKAHDVIGGTIRQGGTIRHSQSKYGQMNSIYIDNVKMITVRTDKVRKYNDSIIRVVNTNGFHTSFPQV